MIDVRTQKVVFPSLKSFLIFYHLILRFTVQ